MADDKSKGNMNYLLSVLSSQMCYMAEYCKF